MLSFMLLSKKVIYIPRFYCLTIKLVIFITKSSNN